MKYSIIYLLLGILLYLPGYSQVDLKKTLPNDPTIRSGKLANGMTYYIRYNDYPKGYANFEIFHSVGALQENANQNGLAHFLEHLAFNGLAHFPGKSMLNYMESIGVKFGSNVNAATSTDYTRYMLTNVPTSRQGIIDTCLLVLYDWSGSILCEQDEINAERGIIEEEWRSRGGINLRVSQVINPIIFNHSKHATHNVIGDMDIIRNFKREELLDFYHTWYHPDMQAVAIVGDFNVDEMEAKVKELFSRLPKKENPKAKEEYNIPDNQQLLYATYSDKEATSTSISILFKHPVSPKENRAIGEVYTQGYNKFLVCSMMSSRLHEMLQNGDYPMTSLSYDYEFLAGNRDVFSISADVKKGIDKIQPAFDLMLQESERIRRYGFTQEELNRVKARAQRSLERNLLEKDKKETKTFIQACFNHFIRNTPILETTTYCEVLQTALEQLTLEKANQIAKDLFRNDNTVITIITSSDDATGIPQQTAVEKELASVRELTLTPYEEKSLNKSFLTKSPTPGRVVNERQIGIGATEWTLSNGIKVYLLPTDYKKDEIEMTAYRWGGYSLVSDKDFSTARTLSSAIQKAKLGSFSATDRSKMLAGKIVYITPFLSDYQQFFDCASTPSDYETMLQIIYLYFTDIQFDEEDFNRMLSQTKEKLIARKAVPFSYLQDTVSVIRENYSPRASKIIVNPNDLDKVDFKRLKPLYKKLFGNPADFTFFFTGAINLEEAKPIIEKYLGSLKTNKETLQWQDIGLRSPKGHINCDFQKNMENPLATSFIEYTKECDYSQKRSTILRLLQGILDIRYTKLIREDKSGTYSVDTECSLKRMPVPTMNLIVSFQTKAEQVDELQAIVYKELKRLAKEGVELADFNKSREYMLKILQQSQTRNQYWHSNLTNYVRFQDDSYANSEQILNSITPEDIRILLQEFIDADNVVSITLRPEQNK